MPRIIDAEHVEPVLRAMVGAADVDGGPTAEQLAVIGALAAGVLRGRRSIPPTVEPLEPGGDGGRVRRSGAAATGAGAARPGRAVPPPGEPRARRSGSRSTAPRWGSPGPGLAIVRDLVERSRAEAAADYMRFFSGDGRRPMLEPQLAERYGGHPRRTRRRSSPPACGRWPTRGPGTLGRGLRRLLRAQRLRPARDRAAACPAVFVSHDMCHVIGGYEPVGDRRDRARCDAARDGRHRHALAAVPRQPRRARGRATSTAAGRWCRRRARLSRPGAAETVAHAFWRGAQCTGDFTTVDHLALRPRAARRRARPRSASPSRDC